MFVVIRMQKYNYCFANPNASESFCNEVDENIYPVLLFYFASPNASESSFICASLMPSGSKPMLRALI